MNFSNIAFFEKVMTDFENRTKRQTETKSCVFFGHGPHGYTLQSKFSPFCNRNISIYFAHFRFEYKQLKKSMTRYS